MHGLYTSHKDHATLELVSSLPNLRLTWVQILAQEDFSLQTMQKQQLLASGGTQQLRKDAKYQFKQVYFPPLYK